MGGKGGGDSGAMTPQTSAQMQQQEPTWTNQQARQQALGQQPVPQPTPQQLQDQQNQRMLQQRSRKPPIPASMDPNAQAGSTDGALGDIAAESVMPEKRRGKRPPYPPPTNTGSV